MRTVGLAELKRKLTDPGRFFLLDVREAEEYEAGHLPGAILAPWDRVAEKVRGLKPSTELVLYCRTGVRAGRAAQTLASLGFHNVSVYQPGWVEWEQLERNP